eukprot:XP_007113868.1 zinc finger protein 74-like [Physeter catodon]
MRESGGALSLCGLPDSKPDVIPKLEQWEDPWTVERDVPRGPEKEALCAETWCHQVQLFRNCVSLLSFSMKTLLKSAATVMPV